MIKLLTLARLGLLSLFILSLQPAAAATVDIGYVFLDDDPEYADRRLDRRLQGHPSGRPRAGMERGIADTRYQLRSIGAEFNIVDIKIDDPDNIRRRLHSAHKQGVQYFLLDLPAKQIISATQALANKDALLFNIVAAEDHLRNAQCTGNLYHAFPSHRMLADALGQFVIFHKFDDLLWLQGQTPADAIWGDALRASMKRYGISIEEERPFIRNNDPRDRERNNVALLTEGDDWDLIVVVDTDGVFAREVPYQTQASRLVIGNSGLTPQAWHWSWERNGAPQLNNRFFRDNHRDMTGQDWAAWVSVQAIAESILRTKSTEISEVMAYLDSPELTVDGFKSGKVNFRPWNGQLRQPIFLTNGTWVAERAPLPGFLHPQENLDTLGDTQTSTQCRARS